MNKPIVRLFGLVLVLFAVLLAFTSRWTIFEAGALRANHLNQRGFIERQRVKRGEILAKNDAVIARDVRSRDSTAAEPTYERRYPLGSEFAAPIGYSFPDPGQTGEEQYNNSLLEGHNKEGELQAILNRLQGKQQAGDKVITTLSPNAQQVAIEALGSYSGAIVALEPSSGAVRVMTSSPSYNPNKMGSPEGASRLYHAAGSPLVNRAVQAGYAPGSTFKVLTATAAIDSGEYTPQSRVSGRNDVTISGVPLANDDNESYGEITLTEALAQSVNTVWAQVAEHLGRQTMEKYMRRFGFERTPKLDYPAEEMEAAGEYSASGRLLRVTNPEVDLGRMGIGQDKLRVTALQMAEVASAVADEGKLMTPYLTDKIIDSEGRAVQETSPHGHEVMKASTAEAVTGMMEAVVNEGTGTEAQIPGVQVAGKTGTAETQFGTSINNVWFIAFAPASEPKVAVAVTVKGVPGYGGTYAAPVARKVIEAVLSE